jgi:universal stress protein A
MMANFAQILVPLDYSDCSDEALRLAARIALAFNGRLLVLHVVPIEISGLFGDFPMPVVDATRIEAETPRLKKHVASVLEGFDPMPALEVEVTWGSPHLDVVPYAIERRVDLIVLGTHGRSGLKHVLLGSVAERTVRTAPCPVLTVHAGAAAGMRELHPGGRIERGLRESARIGEVGRMMTRRPVTVAPDDVLALARDRMASASVRHLPVVEGERLVGILSDRDFPAHIGHLDHTRVNAAMTADPVTVASNVTVDAAARLMIDRNVRALPVVDGDRVIGIISATDILEDYVRAARR